MAISEKQLAANRANAQKSTGPQSDATKAITRLNAKRDGITGQVITLSQEDLPVFEELKAELIADLAPKTVMELKLASSIAWDTWRLDHLRAVEMNMYAMGSADPHNQVEGNNPQLSTAMTDAVTFCTESARFALMSIYEQRLNRGIHKNLATLQALQAARMLNYDRDRAEEVIVARANDINGLPYNAPARRSRNGFLFSTAEILAAANRETILGTTKRTLRMTDLEIQFAGAWDNLDPNRPDSGIRMAAAA